MFWENFARLCESAAKTPSGTRRVPIAQKTAAMWEKLRDERKTPDTRTAERRYAEFADRLGAKMKELGLPDHLPHDTRHSCVSLLTAADVDRILIKRIVGHQGEDVTDMVYTHYDIDQLIKAIDKIDAVIG